MVINFPFEALDDVEARQAMKKFLDNPSVVLHDRQNVVLKLQEISKNAPPRPLDISNIKPQSA